MARRAGLCEYEYLVCLPVVLSLCVRAWFGFVFAFGLRVRVCVCACVRIGLCNGNRPQRHMGSTSRSTQLVKTLHLSSALSYGPTLNPPNFSELIEP